MKIDRKKIHKMFGGKCAYCGSDLRDESGKYMHIDHIEPILRNPPKSQWKEHWGEYKQCVKPEKDIESLMFPSCPKCNNYKGSMSIELFRENIKLSNERLKVYAAYNNALRFGLVKEIEWDGLFWFEKYNIDIANKK